MVMIWASNEASFTPQAFLISLVILFKSIFLERLLKAFRDEEAIKLKAAGGTIPEQPVIATGGATKA